MMRRCLIWALLGLAWTDTALSQDDKLVVRQQSVRFESARNRGALQESRKLLAADATCYDLAGRDSRSLLYDLAISARRRTKSGRDRLEPVRVLSREVSVQGNVAIVTELLGAATERTVSRDYNLYLEEAKYECEVPQGIPAPTA